MTRAEVPEQSAEQKTKKVIAVELLLLLQTVQVQPRCQCWLLVEKNTKHKANREEGQCTRCWKNTRIKTVKTEKQDCELLV